MENNNIKDLELIDRLNAVLGYVKSSFVGKDTIVDLMGICLVGRENLFLLGPPGTAKSAIVHVLAKSLKGKTFEYLLTRFTEPNELFGPFDIRKLREGELVTNTEGMLPEADLVFLDELLNANSAILNSLLMALNERIFRRGRETKKLPALMMVGASNHLPEDEALQALFDRFLIRVRCDYVDPALLNAVLDAGWALEQNAGKEIPEIHAADILHLQSLVSGVDLQAVRKVYLELIQKLRNAGVQVSDRRAVKLQRLIAASALLCKRKTAVLSDLWVLRYIWDTDEQVEIISAIINAAIDTAEPEVSHHPQALVDTAPNADEIYTEVMILEKEWDSHDVTLSQRTSIKDRLRYLNGRCEWISNETQRAYVQKPIDALWQKIIHEPQGA